MIAVADHTNDGWVEGLQQHVHAITLSLQAMMVLLVREREALVARNDAHSLHDIATDKQTAVAQVSALYELQRSAVARNLGSGTSLSEGISALREHSDRIANQVDELVQLTQQCQQANQDNGVLVSAGLDHSQQAVNTLARLGTGHAQAGTYDPSAAQHSSQAGARFTVRA